MPILSFNPTVLEESCDDNNYGSVRKVEYCLMPEVVSVVGSTVTLVTGKAFRKIPHLSEGSKMTIAADHSEQGDLDTPTLSITILKIRTALMSWLQDLKNLPLCLRCTDGNGFVTILYPMRVTWKADSGSNTDQPTQVAIEFVPTRNNTDRFSSFYSGEQPPDDDNPGVDTGDFNYEFSLDFD
jgi:hypothetical protein